MIKIEKRREKKETNHDFPECCQKVWLCGFDEVLLRKVRKVMSITQTKKQNFDLCGFL
jgi:hypothetical protein